MSSFTIAKKEYIKAAGLVAGLAEGLSKGPRQFWMYDSRLGRNSTADDFYNKFAEFYTMNALSVAEQYDLHSPVTNTEEYRAEFEEYRKKGHNAAFDGLKTATMELRSFFHSAQYQTENEAYNWQMTMYFDRIIDQLLEFLIPGEWSSWGTLEI